MFQNKRRRYSHESRGHTVRRRPLPGIGAVQDPGRCQVDLLLDARTPRGRTRRPPMRVTRSACGATAARSMGQEDQARPGACGHRHVAPPRQPDHEGRGHGGLVSRARYRPHPARPNDDPAPNILGREFDGYAPAHAHRRRPGLRGGVGSSWACICLPGELANREIAGHAVGTRRDADLVLAAFAALRFPLGGIEVFHTD